MENLLLGLNLDLMRTRKFILVAFLSTITSKVFFFLIMHDKSDFNEQADPEPVPTSYLRFHAKRDHPEF